MVRVVKICSRYYGIDKSQYKGDFWGDVRAYAEMGEPVIIADTRQEAQEVCDGEIDWRIDWIYEEED